MLKAFHDFERFILEQWNFDESNHPAAFEQNGNPNFKCYLTEGVLKKINLVDDQDISWLNKLNEYCFEQAETIGLLQQKSELVQKSFLLIYVRNKFAHNQLPNKELFELLKRYLPDNDEGKLSFSEVILNFVVETIPFLKIKCHKTQNAKASADIRL